MALVDRFGILRLAHRRGPAKMLLFSRLDGADVRWTFPSGSLFCHKGRIPALVSRVSARHEGGFVIAEKPRAAGSMKRPTATKTQDTDPRWGP